jgi:hypothetical protein
MKTLEAEHKNFFGQPVTMYKQYLINVFRVVQICIFMKFVAKNIDV